MRLVLLFAILIFPFSTVAAHPPTVLNSAAAQDTIDELQDFRRRMAQAIRSKDVANLRTMYASTFQHIHTSGKLDGRDARIVSAVSGDPVIETTETIEQYIHIHAGGWAAVVTGLSPIKAMTDGKTYAVRWTQMFVRNNDGWQLASSQATRSHELKPP